MKYPVIYIKAEEATFLTSARVRICDVASVYCRDRKTEKLVGDCCIYRFDEDKEARIIVSVLMLIREIEQILPNVRVISIGEQDMVISYKPESMKLKPWLLKTKILLICLTCFFGTGVSIMEYNNDVDISKIFAQLYETFTGVKPNGPTFIELFYSIGLTLWIFLFFNHIPGKRVTDEPTPIQVQMRLYEKDVNQTFVTDAGRKGKEMGE